MKGTTYFILGGSHDECIIGAWPGWQNPVTIPRLWWGSGIVGPFGKNNPGLRFQVDLPDYTHIDKVRLRVHTEHERWYDLRHRLFGRKCLDAPPWTSRADYLAAPLTTAYWQGNLLPWLPDDYYYFDITDIFLELVNQPGFASGNHIALMFWGPITGTTNKAAARSWAGDPFDPAIIICSYSKDDPPPIPPEPKPLPPKPNPTIPEGRFYVTDLVIYFQEGDAFVSVLTDVPCFLFLRWTDIEPEKHKTRTEIRGRPWYVDVKLCFVEYNDIPQIEPENSYCHTFRWPDWHYCTERWFYIWGNTFLFWEPWSEHLDYYHDWVSPPFDPPTALTVRQGRLGFQCNGIDMCSLHTVIPERLLPIKTLSGIELHITNLFGSCYSASDAGDVALKLHIYSEWEWHILQYFAHRSADWLPLGDSPIFTPTGAIFPVPQENKIRNIYQDWKLVREHLGLSTDPLDWYLHTVYLEVEHHGGTQSGWATFGPIDFSPTTERLPSVSNTPYWRLHLGDLFTSFIYEPWTS